MMPARTYPTLLLALMGSMDCFTTVIGILYFGAVELNPLIAGVVSANLPAFVALKLTITVFTCLIFVQVEKILMKAKDKKSKGFKYTRRLFKLANVCVDGLLFVVVANNVFVLANSI